MPKGNPSYFGIQLGQAAERGLGHISDALQRAYEIKRDRELMDRQAYNQELANRIALAGKGVQVPNVPASQNWGPMGPQQEMRFPDLSQVHQDYLANKELERRTAEANIEATRQRGQMYSMGPTSPAEKSVDIAFGKEYANYVAGGGFADVEKQIKNLEDVYLRLKSGAKLTGPIRSMYPESVRKRLDPKSIAAQQQVEESIQRSLRQTLGAQFTEAEGKMFLARAYDPALGPEENAKKLESAIQQLKNMARAKESAIKYYEQYGTLKGFKGDIGQSGSPMPTTTMGPTMAQPGVALPPEKAQRLMELRAKKAVK